MLQVSWNDIKQHRSRNVKVFLKNRYMQRQNHHSDKNGSDPYLARKSMENWIFFPFTSMTHSEE